MRDLEGFCNRLSSRRDLHPDIELVAFGRRYPAHRVILASQSTYFDVLLRWLGERSLSSVSCRAPHSGDDTAQDGPPQRQLALGEDVTQKGFEWILDYFYASPHTGITGDNALDVLAAAHYLGVGPVQSACVNFLAQHLDPTNLGACLAWATRADHGEASDMLGAACRRLLALRLPAELGAWGPALPHIEPRCLVEIVGCDQLAVAGEFERYQLVKRVAELCAASPASGTRRSSLDDQEQQQQAARHSSNSSGTGSSGGASAAAAGAPGGARDSRRASGAGGAAAEDGSEGGAPGGRDEGEAALQLLLSSALNLPEDDRLARHLQLLRPCSPPAGAGPSASAPAACLESQLVYAGAAQPSVLLPPQLPALRLQPARGADGIINEPAARTSAFMLPGSCESVPAGGALLCASPSDCGSVLGSSGFGGAFGGGRAVGGGGAGMNTLESSSTTTVGCSSTASARNTLRIWDSLGFGVCEAASGEGEGEGDSGRARSSGGLGRGVASFPSSDSVNLAPLYGSEGVGLEEDVVGAPLTADRPGGAVHLPGLVGLEVTDADVAAAAPPPQHQQRSPRHEPIPVQQPQQQHSPAPSTAALAPALNINISSNSAASAAASLAASRLALLCEAVRFEHLTVPQLMAVQAEGLVPPALLHAALWQRTCLDLQIHQRGAAAAAAAAAGAAASPAGAGSAALGTPRAGQQPQQGQQPPQGHRPFRMCWRLRCGALKKLAAGDMLQSEPQQYAGAMWQVRLTCRDKDASRGHLGLYLGRHLAPTGSAAGSTGGPGGAGAQLTPRRRDGAGGGQRPPMPYPGHGHGHGYGHGYGQQYPGHNRLGPRPPPQQQQQQPQQPRGNSPPQPQRQQAQQPQQPQQQAAAAAPPAAAQQFFAFTDRQPALPSRCRLTAYQTDNTALSGRLCLGDSGDFESAFAAGGFFGAGRLLARADLEALPDEADVLVFVSLQAEVGLAPGVAAGGGGAAGGGLGSVPEQPEAGDAPSA
ncbi:hypothetical protein HXX76_001958 [Chlamydomonas incerta]|uniref:BTB domain-containing protein n=1 Tax=Chlamydomonas incerta TaxID=51695 RepID=A0A835WA62_CHLIN|nr:hypothetical protein HXX76_001958 [Chlamydomonas incerta]|eukprot:KAG2443607.1 hypothetical protein HXX76_001958 [Chlamydomonas incerta]